MVNHEAGCIRMFKVQPVRGVKIPQVLDDFLSRINVVGIAGIKVNRLAHRAGIGLGVNNTYRRFFKEGAGQDNDVPGSSCTRSQPILSRP